MAETCGSSLAARRDLDLMRYPRKLLSSIQASAWRGVDGGPGPRYAIQSIWDSHNKRLLVIAGETNVVAGDKLTGFVMHEDVWAFDPEKEAWTALSPARFARTTAWDEQGQRLFVQGGIGAGGQFTSVDLWIYDVVGETWTSRGDPEARGASFPAGEQVPTTEARGASFPAGEQVPTTEARGASREGS